MEETNRQEELMDEAIRDAKVEVYDLMAAQEQIKRRIAELNQRIITTISQRRPGELN